MKFTYILFCISNNIYFGKTNFLGKTPTRQRPLDPDSGLVVTLYNRCHKSLALSLRFSHTHTHKDWNECVKWMPGLVLSVREPDYTAVAHTLCRSLSQQRVSVSNASILLLWSPSWTDPSDRWIGWMIHGRINISHANSTVPHAHF